MKKFIVNSKKKYAFVDIAFFGFICLFFYGFFFISKRSITVLHKKIFFNNYVSLNKKTEKNTFSLDVNTVCSASEAERISNIVRPLNDVSHCCTNCPERNYWIQVLLNNSWEYNNFMVFSVGCNKGDDLIDVMAGFSGNVIFNRTKFRHTMSQTIGKELNGACPDSKIVLKTPWTEMRQVKGICIEPMRSTVQALLGTICKLKLNDEIHIVEAAVSNKPGKSKFANMDVGVESVGLEFEFNQGNNYTEIDILTLDQIVESTQTNRIDLLSIDAEGYDYLVFEGSHTTFSSVYVRFLEFEYHSVFPWPKYSLHNLIRYLDIMMFDCYWQGNQGQLWRLTGCFHEHYKSRATWSNVMCVNRLETKAAHELYNIAKSFEKWGAI